MSNILRIASKNTCVDSSNPSVNFGSYYAMFTGKYAGVSTYRTFLQFDLSSIPTGCVIKKAELILYIMRNQYPSGSKEFSIYRNQQNFEQNTVNYNNQPQIYPVPYTNFTISDELNTFLTIDVTALLSDWVKGKYNNYGLSLRASNESLPTLVAFYTTNSVNDIYYPQLEITIEEPVEISSRKFSSTLNVGSVTTDTFNYSKGYDVSEVSNYTVFIVNTGSVNSSKVKIQISPDYLNWVDDSSEIEVTPENMVRIYPRTFSKFVRLAYKSSTAGHSTSIDYYLQTQS